MLAFWGIGRWPRARTVFGLVAGTLAVGITLVGGEATIRARLGPVADRAPTMLHARSTPWGGGRVTASPVPIGALAAGLDESRVPVTLDELPDHLIEAVVAVEDRRFFAHRGLDLRRIAGALVANARAGEVTQGGSTITQQLAKNLFLSNRRTPLRKMREAAMALRLEERYEKRTILEAYLNEIYLGQDASRAIRGVGAAARYYFDKSVGDLSLGESALLAGMIRAPNWYTPVRHPDRARERRDVVLRLMVEQGRAGERDVRRAAGQRVRTRPVPERRVSAPYFRDYVLRRIPQDAGHALPPRGAAVHTTLDATLQRAAERAVHDGLARLGMPNAQAALVAIDPSTGDILAMVGGRDYAASQFNRAADARRQPGSAFKPIVALAALGRDGSSAPAFTLASVIEDEPLSVVTPAGRWEPQNYDGGFRGPVTLRQALELSLNVPIARVGLAVGPSRVASTGLRLGIVNRLRPVPSLALGSSEVTPLELTRAYGVLATGGQLADTRVLLGVSDAGGVRATRSPPVRRVADPAETYLVTSALEGAVARGTGRALNGLGYRGGLAGKSGTSSEWRDGWFVAYTPTLVAGAWVGYDDGRSLGLSGSRSALPIVSLFLRDALRAASDEPFPVPDGVEFAYVGTERGWWGWECSSEPEVFLAGTVPDTRCTGWRQPRRWVARLDTRADQLVDAFAGALHRYGDELADLLGRRGDEVVRRLAELLAERNRRRER